MKALVGAFNQEKALVSRGLLRDCTTSPIAALVRNCARSPPENCNKMVRVMLCASHLRRGEGEETLDWLSSLIGNSKNKFYPHKIIKLDRDIKNQGTIL